MRLPLIAVFLAATIHSQAQLSSETESKIANAVGKILRDTGVPSASVGIVQGGKIVYTHAFGLANMNPPRPATAGMAYPIGSISKQFTAQAVLLLQQEGKLSLDDKVSKWFPELTRANEVSLRNLMTMTSGYEDFAPQDYIIPAWRKPVDPLALVHEWAGKPLDFNQGDEWQYSNTNYVLVALIVQKVAGEPFYQFLRERVLSPLHLEGIFNTYTQSQRLQVTGYVSYALNPPRVLALEAPGWYFGDGDLAMPAATLLTWDLSTMNKSLLSPASYAEFETPFRFNNGKDSDYGLGVHVYNRNGHRELQHGGEVGGYVSENVVYPDDGVAMVALTNEVASEAADDIIYALTPMIIPTAVAAPARADAFAPQLKTILAAMQSGKIDRSLFTADCNAYFDDAALADFQTTLAPLGTITTLNRTRTLHRGGMEFGLYRVTFSSGTTLILDVLLKPDGKIEQLLITGKA